MMSERVTCAGERDLLFRRRRSSSTSLSEKDSTSFSMILYISKQWITYRERERERDCMTDYGGRYMLVPYSCRDGPTEATSSQPPSLPLETHWLLTNCPASPQDSAQHVHLTHHMTHHMTVSRHRGSHSPTSVPT